MPRSDFVRSRMDGSKLALYVISCNNVTNRSGMTKINFILGGCEIKGEGEEREDFQWDFAIERFISSENLFKSINLIICNFA